MIEDKRVVQKDQQNNEEDQFLQPIELIPKESVISSAMEGKLNTLICFKGREEFLHNRSESIATYAITGKHLYPSSYGGIGIEGTDSKERETKSREVFREGDILNLKNKIDRNPHIFNDGKNDFVFIYGADNNKVAYAWLPSTESTGDYRTVRNIIAAEFKPEAIKKIQSVLEDNPTQLYQLLISSLFPEMFIPLTRGQILEAVEEKGENVIKIIKSKISEEQRVREAMESDKEIIEEARVEDMNKIELLESRVKNPNLLFIEKTISSSTLERESQCVKVKLI